MFIYIYTIKYLVYGKALNCINNASPFHKTKQNKLSIYIYILMYFIYINLVYIYKISWKFIINSTKYFISI